MEFWFAIKTLHIISSTVLFGTGLGIAFFMFRSWFTKNLQERLYAARATVLADWCFTLPAIIIQPLTGFWLMLEGGYDWQETWLLVTFAIYALAGACWLPVVWLQIRMKQMLEFAHATGDDLPEKWNRYFRLWFILGWPAFVGLVIVFGLMVMRPT